MAVAAATPDSIPFGMAAEVLPEDGGEEIGEEADANIPLPTWRPDDEENASETSLVALAAPEPELSEVGLAALNSSEATSIEDEIEAEVQENNQRLAMLSQPAGLKDAVATLAKGSRPVAGGVKTTQKAARARVGDTKPAPKPLVVAAQPEAARWALGGRHRTRLRRRRPVDRASEQRAERGLCHRLPAQHCRCRRRPLLRQGDHLHAGRPLPDELEQFRKSGNRFSVRIAQN